MSFGVTLDTRGLDELPEEMARKSQQALMQTAEAVEGIAADLAHIISGAMRAGLYISSSEGSTYEAAVAIAQALLPDVVILPEVPQPPPGVVILADCTEQSFFEEFGTTEHAPHQFMTPAALAGEPIFQEKLEDLGRSL